MVNVNPLNSNSLLNMYKNQTTDKKSANGLAVSNNSLNENLLVKPYSPKGHLVKGGLGSGAIFKDYANAFKNFGKALKGEGSDYSVGNVNDYSIQLGSLGIAAALASKGHNKVSRTMQFVGFATWFGAMAIFPKAFIGAPVKAKTGVDINLKYVDSYGRKKRFFGDAQYIPWDLYSDKKISKIGDKLGIPENIENRRDAIQDKMKQIAIQTNTLWMLTAGVATPLLSSLMASQLEKAVEDTYEAVNTHKGLRTAKNNMGESIKELAEEKAKNILANNPEKNMETVEKEQLEKIQKLFKGENKYKKTINKISQPLAWVSEKLSPKSSKLLKQTNLEDTLEELRNVVKDRSLSIEVIHEYKKFIKNGEVGNKEEILKNIEKLNKLYSIIGKVDESTIGKDWTRVTNDSLKALGFKKADFEALATKPKSEEFLTNYIMKMSRKQLRKAKKEIAEMSERTISKAELVQKLIQKEIKDLPGAKMAKMEVLEDRVRDIRASFGKLNLAVEERLFISKSNKNIKNIQEGEKNIIPKFKEELGTIIKRKKLYELDNDSIKIIENALKEEHFSGETLEKLKNVLKNIKKETHPKYIKNLILGHTTDNLLDDYVHFAKKTDNYTEEFKKLVENEKQAIDKYFGFLKTANPAQYDDILTEVEKGVHRKNFDVRYIDGKNIDAANRNTKRLSNWIGQTYNEMVLKAARAKNNYKSWLKKPLTLGIALLGVTFVSILTFGKTNKYNPDIYKVKGE